ncbi:hypothetical protein [Elizabethkingia miricola]|uniref:hypothetical protein n=1 Tax=Elizabethkingia miricola TaxID=172045 RepID=UPI00099935AF|nr:hypothetical protein [Elizabethkingia miricola]OPC34583.1 hypothetical protein BAX99_06870 [Elizabethkingia miricola]
MEITDYNESTSSGYSSYTKVVTNSGAFTIGHHIVANHGIVASHSETNFISLTFYYNGRTYYRRIYKKGKYFPERSTSIHAGKFARQIKKEVDNGK